MRVKVVLEMTLEDIAPVLMKVEDVFKRDTVSIGSIEAVDECKAAFLDLCSKAFEMGREFERNNKEG